LSSLTFDFSGRSVVITGAASGIGLALARQFSAAGAHTCLVDVDSVSVTAQAAELGAHGVAADVSRREDADRVIEEVIADCGQVDVLVNNAGIVRDRVLWRLSDEDWSSVLSVHLGGTFHFTRACIPHFREREYGRVVNVTSYTGLHGNIGQAAYAAAKAGIIGFTKTAAKELARFGVTVNAISPMAKTAMLETIPAEQSEALRKLIPAARYAEPEEMCSAVGFLASEEAAYITGVVLPVDGGMSM
jgi:3-oxoacyl-[acyl-carrier protein] reductase